MIQCSSDIESSNRLCFLVGKQKGSTKSKNLTAYDYLDFHYLGNSLCRNVEEHIV